MRRRVLVAPGTQAGPPPPCATTAVGGIRKGFNFFLDRCEYKPRTSIEQQARVGCGQPQNILHTEEDRIGNAGVPDEPLPEISYSSRQIHHKVMLLVIYHKYLYIKSLYTIVDVWLQNYLDTISSSLIFYK